MNEDRWVQAGRAAARLSRLLEHQLAGCDLSLPQYRSLALLSKGDEAASRLADHLAVSRPSVTALVDGLVARGLVERRASEDDRRRVLHVITPAGTKALHEADALLADALASLAGGLDDPEQVLDGLIAVADALDLARAEAASRWLITAEGADVALDDDPPAPSFGPPLPIAEYDTPTGAIDPDGDLGWIRRMLPVVRRHRTSFAIAMGMAAVALVANVAIPAVVGKGIDEVSDGGDGVGTWVTVLVVLALLRAVFTYGYRNRLYQFAYAIEYDLRALMFRHMAHLSHGFYDKVQTGQLVSRANSDIRAVQMLLAFAPFLGMMVLTFVLAFGYMLTVNVLLTLVAVSTLPLVYVVGLKLRSAMFPLSWIIQGRLAEVATIVEENVTGVRVVKAFAGERRQIHELAVSARRLRWAAVEAQDQRARWGPIMENLPRLGMAFTLAYGGWLAIEGQVGVGTIVVFSSYVLLLQGPFRMLGFFLMMSQRAAASAGRIFEILDTPAEIVDREGAVDLVAPRGEVSFDRVRFRYGGDDDDAPDVLDGFDLRIAPGETVALVGGTGSGKTTVARVLLRFYDVNDGAVRIDGHDLRDLTMVSLRHHVGMVLDEPFLFSATLRDNIAYARPDATDEEVVAAAKAANAHDFISALPDGYDAVVGERGYTLSGGQRQRVAIARTLLANPAVLILDDATSAVDVRVEAQIHEALERLAADRTTIVIAHRLSTIALADRVVVVDAGRVLATGTHRELLVGEPRYREILASVEADEETADQEPADVEDGV